MTQNQTQPQLFREYKLLYEESIANPDSFWATMAENFEWKKKWEKVCQYNYDRNAGPISVNWFQGGSTNITVNCLDRHLETKGDKTALIWEGNTPGESRTLTYKELHREVCRFANVLKNRGIRKGMRIALYMPMIPELLIATLACARIGAIHSIVFGGFSAQSLSDRLVDLSCATIITADGAFRENKTIPLKAIADEAAKLSEQQGQSIDTFIVVKRIGEKQDFPCAMIDSRDFWWHEEMNQTPLSNEPEWLNSEDPLFILYTSGSTGKPKGILHSVGGYMVYAATTFKYIFDHKDSDVHWCTADMGWITGHSYIAYGPLLNGATTLMFEGVPTWPDAGRFWDVVDKHQVSLFYTSPTVIRTLQAKGDQFVTRYSRSSLRLLATVGEPINPSTWQWYHDVVGDKRCPVVDTWWQTETGGILIAPLPQATPTKPGSATLPFFGVQPVVLDPESGKELDGESKGVLAIKSSWPGQMRTIYGDHERFEATYFSTYNNYYFTGDGCRRDKDGYYWITGRMDDVINVSGHRLGTAEIENALVSHPGVSESAVVGFSHPIKGQGIYAYVTLDQATPYTDDFKQTLIQHVRKEIGPIATPDNIHWAPVLPKTRSGKIMRRILKKIASDEWTDLGDTSTLADPSAIEALIQTKTPNTQPTSPTTNHAQQQPDL